MNHTQANDSTKVLLKNNNLSSSLGQRGEVRQSPAETAERYWHQLNNLYKQAKRQHNEKVMRAVIQLMSKRGGIF